MDEVGPTGKVGSGLGFVLTGSWATRVSGFVGNDSVPGRFYRRHDASPHHVNADYVDILGFVCGSDPRRTLRLPGSIDTATDPARLVSSARPHSGRGPSRAASFKQRPTHESRSAPRRLQSRVSVASSLNGVARETLKAAFRAVPFDSVFRRLDLSVDPFREPLGAHSRLPSGRVHSLACRQL